MIPLHAAVDLAPLLNKVSFELQAEKWVTTGTAQVNVLIDAAITDQDIGKIQASVLTKLKELSPQGEWHIVSFDRQQAQSGLENITIVAQNRLPPNALSGLRDKAKEISKAGETYRISDVQFVPSDQEMREAMTELRNKIYMQAQSEIANLNRLYPDQNFYLYQIYFNSSNAPVPMAANLMAAKANTMAQPLTVGNKMILNASVIIAAMPKEFLQAVHGN